MIAARLSVPVVPVRLQGFDRILNHSWAWPARGTGLVTFGEAMSFSGNDYGAIAKEIEEAVRSLGNYSRG